jgi:hypothetical protein
MENKSSQAVTVELYMHGAGSVCINCGEHVSKHTSQFVKSSPFGRAYVCPVESAS